MIIDVFSFIIMILVIALLAIAVIIVITLSKIMKSIDKISKDLEKMEYKSIDLDQTIKKIEMSISSLNNMFKIFKQTSERLIETLSRGIVRYSSKKLLLQPTQTITISREPIDIDQIMKELDAETIAIYSSDGLPMFAHPMKAHENILGATTEIANITNQIIEKYNYITLSWNNKEILILKNEINGKIFYTIITRRTSLYNKSTLKTLSNLSKEILVKQGLT